MMIAILLCTPLAALCTIWIIEHWPGPENVVGSHLDMTKERREILLGYERGRQESIV